MRAPKKQAPEPEAAEAPQPEASEPPPQADQQSAGAFGAAAEGVRTFASGRFFLALVCILGGLAAGLILAVMQGVIVPPEAFQTQGSIYMASPEVYTRERLVNDRYDEDYWLHRQLDRLDDTKALVTGSDVSSVAAALGLRAGAAEGGRAADNLQDRPATNPPPRPGSDYPFPFDQDFLIRSGIRDAIRQLILENLLDDRHDLTGNSVYGLKFDISIVPGTMTYERAFARVSIVTDDWMHPDVAKGDDAAAAVPELPAKSSVLAAVPIRVRQYYSDPSARNNPASALSKDQQLYEDWLRDVSSRLTSYAEQIHDQNCIKEDAPAADQAKAITKWATSVETAIDTVLGIGGGVVTDPAGLSVVKQTIRRQIQLPQPWSGHLRIAIPDIAFEPARGPQADDREMCLKKPRFLTEPVFDVVYVLKPGPGQRAANFLQIAQIDDVGAFVSTRGLQPDQTDQAMPKYSRAGNLIAFLKENELLPAPVCISRSDTGDCTINASTVVIPTGLFNFIDSTSKIDSYTYALFPRSDVAGFLSGRSFAGSAGASGEGGVSGNFAFNRNREEAETIPRSIGFSDASTSANSIDFGWIIGTGTEPIRETQKSGLALVSVPAWISQLTIKVETGWLRSDASEVVAKQYEYTIPIPQDYEVFDSFIGNAKAQREPRIIDDLMPKGLSVTACENASIAIPGFRLWRSTVVTLGGAKADRITVMPNMRGIIAEFQPYVPTDATSVAEQLRVWTSEGFDTAQNPIVVNPARDTRHCDKTPPPPPAALGPPPVQPVVAEPTPPVEEPAPTPPAPVEERP